jgi:hypothetical protein
MAYIPIKSAVVGTANANTAIQDAHELLRQAGIASMQNRAAFLPGSSESPLPELAPRDANPPCPSTTALQLAWLVKHRQNRLQEIWINKLAALKMGLPYEWIVPILQRGTANQFHSPETLLGLLGERGRWVAGLQNEWGWIFKQVPFRSQLRNSDDGESGTQILKEIRHRNPDEGREWLIRNWDDLRHDGRRWHYLEVLRAGLDKSDEVWLMNIAAGLHDGASDLLHEAQIALQLLSLLPQQALVDDLCAKVFSTMHLEKTGKLILDFVWSVSYEGQLVYKAHIGLTNLMNIFDWRLSLDAILKLIPMNAWTEHFEVEPADLLSAASHGTHAGVFADAWSKRILYEESNEFAIAWLRRFARLQEIGGSQFHSIESDAIALFEILSFDEIIEVLREYVGD